MADWGNILSGIGQAAGGLFGGKGGNPEAAANKYLNQIPGAVNPYYRPYQAAGINALGKLQGQYGEMTDNPGAFYNKLAGGYTQSPGYDFKLKQALNARNNAAAAGGMSGTPQHEQQSMETAEGIANQDFENYLNHVLGIFGKGQQGYEGINTQGFDANTQFGQMLAQLLGNQAQYAYGSETQKNINNSNKWGNILSGIGTAVSGFL